MQPHLGPGRDEVFAYKRERKIFLHRVLVLRVVAIVMFCVLVARVGYLQLVKYDNFTTAAEDNRIQLQPLAPERGEITDVHGNMLATNRLVRSVFYAPDEIENNVEALLYLATILDLNDQELTRLQERFTKHQGKKSFPILVKSDITEAQEATIMVRAYRLPGLYMQNSYERYYPYGKKFSHIVGYVGQTTQEIIDSKDFDKSRYVATDQVGRSGLERRFENLLQGYPGWEKVEVDVHGQIQKTMSQSQAKPGKRIQLGLDANLQELAYDLLQDKRGSVVIIEPATGRVMALVSKPGFDPNLFVRGIDNATYVFMREHPDQPFFSRFSQGYYAPASTIKPFYAFSIMNQGLVDSQKKIFDKGYFQIEGDTRIYRNWKRTGHGLVDLRRAIRVSNDTYFFYYANMLGQQPFLQSLQSFGFGRKVAIDIPNERPGVAPTKVWKRQRFNTSWYAGDTINMSIGQGYVLVTPLQLAAATAIVANRGKVVQPRVLIGIDNQPVQSWRNTQPLPDLPSDSATWEEIIASMVDVLADPEGTAYRVGRSSLYPIAGKTGTAQLFTLRNNERYVASEIESSLHDNGLFIGFAPVDNPQIAVAVVVENGGAGSQSAAPIAISLINSYLAKQVAQSDTHATGIASLP